MKAHYRALGGKLTIEVEAPDAKGIFKSVSDLQTIFESETSCGLCQSANLQLRVRTSAQDDDYYELLCVECRATFAFGQTKKGGLFPKRKDAEGSYLPDRGWKIWKAQTEGSNMGNGSGLQSVPRNASRF